MAEKIIGTSFWVIVLFLLIANADAANNIINAVGNSYRKTVGAFQGGL